MSLIKHRARQVYKELSYLAQFYPDPAYDLPRRVKACFRANMGLEGEKLERGVEKAEFIKKELEALYFLKKYRTMKNRYYN